MNSCTSLYPLSVLVWGSRKALADDGSRTNPIRRLVSSGTLRLIYDGWNKNAHPKKIGMSYLGLIQPSSSFQPKGTLRIEGDEGR